MMMHRWLVLAVVAASCQGVSCQAEAAADAVTQAGLTVVAAPRALAEGAVVEDWPGFLGPRRDGTCRESPLLDTWPASGPQLLWTLERGEGYASPAVASGRVVYPHRLAGRMVVDCLDAETGRRLWRFDYPCDYRGRYISNNGARSTPQIDGEVVYVHGVEGMLHCLAMATGEVVWKRDLKADYQLEDMFFGVVGSPLITGDKMILNLGANEGRCVVALDKNTGKELWAAGEKWGMSCASAVLATVHGKPRVLVLAGGVSRPPTGGLVVLDPDTGVVEAEYPFRSRTYESVNGANPVAVGNRVLLTSSYGTGTTAVDLLADGGAELAWTNRKVGIEFSTPMAVGEHVYAVQGAHDRIGGVVCLDVASGEQVSRTDFSWDETVFYQGRDTEVSFSVGSGSMLRVGDAFLCLGDNGHLLWLECTPQEAVVKARASLFRANETWTPPVISHGLLYVCQNKRERFGAEPAPPRLLCFDLRGR